MKKLLPLIGAGAGGLIAFSLLFTWLFTGGIGTAGKLDLAMRLLDEGKWDVAGRIARDLEEAGLIEPEANAAWNYVQGLSKLLSIGDDLDSPRNRRILGDATEHLIKANEIGFPIGYNGKGKFYLGWCYFNTYRFNDVTKVLKDSEQLWPQRRSDAFKINIESNLRQVPADYAEVARLLEKWDAIPGLSLSEKSRIALARAQYAFELDDFAACEQHLTSVSPSTKEQAAAELWRGRWRIAEAAKLAEADQRRTELLDEASEIIRTVMLSAATPTNIRRQSQFLSGRILRLQNKMQEAIGTLSTVRHASPQSAEAITSSLEEAEILLEAGNLEETVATCHLMLRNIEDLNLYNGYWLPVEELRSRLLEIGRVLSREQEYDYVVKLASHIALAFPPTDSVRLKAEAYLRWGDQLAAQQAGLPRESQIPLRAKAEAKYTAAAEQFEQLARLELRSTEFPEILWRAISAHQAANDLENANRLLKDYLKYEERTIRPRGYLALAKNNMNAGEWKQAITPLQLCINEYPGHAILYDVRLMAAKARMELDDLDEAIELLEENLFDHELAPRSDTWRDSMYHLGLLRYKRGQRAILTADTLPRDGRNTEDILRGYREGQADLAKALEHLGHASTRYENQPKFYESRYLMAVAKRNMATTNKALAEENDAIIESARRKLLTNRRELLNETLTQYRELRDEAAKNQELFESAEQFRTLTRNCQFGEADTLFDLGEWEQAAAAYRNVAGRYMSEPESLEALVQLADCHRKLGKTEEARKTIEQAQQVLGRIPAEMDSQFVSLTRADRAGWDNLLKWLKQWD